MNSNLRYAIAAGVMLLAGVFLQLRSGAEVVPARQAMAELPIVLGEWRGEDVALDPQVVQILGEGDFLYRIYRAESKPMVDLFVAYFPTQRTGSTIHSPQNCLPGAGWVPVQRERVTLQLPDGRPISVNQFVIAKSLDRQVVIYWYQSNGRYVASEYWAKAFLVADSMRRNRSDGALVRVVTPVSPAEQLADAQQRAQAFARELLAPLEKHIPR